jgi:hypothetical protein
MQVPPDGQAPARTPGATGRVVSSSRSTAADNSPTWSVSLDLSGLTRPSHRIAPSYLRPSTAPPVAGVRSPCQCAKAGVQTAVECVEPVSGRRVITVKPLAGTDNFAGGAELGAAGFAVRGGAGSWRGVADRISRQRWFASRQSVLVVVLSPGVRSYRTRVAAASAGGSLIVGYRPVGDHAAALVDQRSETLHCIEAVAGSAAAAAARHGP